MPHETTPLTQSVRERLKAAGISQERVAVVLGLTQPMISRRVLGKTPWRADELVAIADAFDIPLAELYGKTARDGEPSAAAS